MTIDTSLPYRVCIVKLSAMGDIVHSMIALQFIVNKFPNCKIDWIVEDSFKELLEYNLNVNEILPINLKSIKKNFFNIVLQYKLIRKYSKNQYDIIIDAQGLIKSAIVSLMLKNSFTKCKVFGFDKYSIREKMASVFYNEKVNIRYNENVILRNLKVMCKPFKINITTNEINNKQPFLFFKKNKQKIKKPYILFVIGASKLNKIYPKKNFLKIANLLKEKPIKVIWANKDEEKVARFLEANAHNVTMCKKMNLNDLKQSVCNASFVIGADTGPTHMAWALNIPSITIFGNTPSKRNTFITKINKTIMSSSVVDALNLDKKDFSIQNISPKKIVKLYRNIIND